MDFGSEIELARRSSSGGLRSILKMSPAKRREARWGLFFISPWLIGFLLFYLAPMVVSLIFSTYNFTLSAPDDAQFIGLSNWQRMLFDDPKTWESLFVTLKFALISLPISMITAFMLAVLLNSKHLLGRNLFRTLFYAPTMVPLIAAILIWSAVLNPQTGWLNRVIEFFGIPAVGMNGLRWMDDPNLIYIAYTFIGLYGIGNAILINLASLQNVPTELYEAAEIDGAGWVRRLWTITIPMVTPVIFYNLVLSIVGLLQFFIVPWVLNRGNGYPEGTTNYYMVYFYKQAFTFQNMGYGAALAWLMFIVALIITMFLFSTGRYWVYYSGKQRS
ncbi:MAG: sugar ABC transporter permease [Anaerolineae bacterium]|nr:sugar ABC transporter permease [Anaerolineae bacterium]